MAPLPASCLMLSMDCSQAASNTVGGLRGMYLYLPVPGAKVIWDTLEVSDAYVYRQHLVDMT